MRAAKSFTAPFLPRKYFGKRSLRRCATSAKGENIVLIEVDSDDFGDVIILDVPESLQEKFRKNEEHHVISIDDDDNASDSRAGKCDMADGATTSNRFSSASAVRRSNSADVNEAGPFVGEGSKPVKLSKSRRTYSGKGISRNQYGLRPDSESCSSESDDSDCELMEDSFGKLREEWMKASFRRRHDANVHSDTEDKAGPSASNIPVHNSDQDAAEHLKPTSNLSNLSSLNHDSDSQKFAEGNGFSQQDSDAKEMDRLSTRKRDRQHGSSDLENNARTCESDQPFQDSTGCSTAEPSELPQDSCCFTNSSFNHEKRGIFSDFAEKLAEQSKGSQQETEAEEMTKIFTGNYSDDNTKGTTDEDIDSDPVAFDDSELTAAGPARVPNNSSGSHHTELKSSSDHNDIITDRQKIKETDEYKRAMEEEWASRQQQLLRQAEEARRLRDKKRAESMRIMDNERRQRLRLEEIRETRRKDEEKLNLKDKLRAEIRDELQRLETMCSDMASLLRALGIHVGGGRHPSSNEVQAAYKRACLRFHPDRVSTTDLRQQVEAEEKFKLISNMKDRFSLVR